MTFENNVAYAKKMDLEDPLANFQDQFHIPRNQDGSKVLYFCGNSLGLQPKITHDWVHQELDDWKDHGVEGHFQAKRPWVSYHHEVKKSLGKVVGGSPTEVVAMNTLSNNLHMLMVSFYRPTKDRHKILVLNQAFPSDQYAVASQVQFHGFDPKTSLLEVGPNGADGLVDEQELYQIIEGQGAQIALILIEGVCYITGQRFDLKKISQLGHDQGCVVGADLAHAIGNVELDLHGDGVDFAVWCSYKYLNGGPGCIGGAFVHDRHAQSFDLPLFAGWWGHDEKNRFLMEKEFKPMAGIDRWQVSNIPILTTACLQASLSVFDQATMPALRKKSEKLTGFLEFLIDENFDGQVDILTPRESIKRGCQLSLKIKGGKATFEKIINHGVMCDWREPNVIRMAPVPLYNSFEDVFTFIQILKDVL